MLNNDVSIKVLLPYGFLLEDNFVSKQVYPQLVLLPYGFLLEDNKSCVFLSSHKVLLPYGFLLEDNQPQIE